MPSGMGVSGAWRPTGQTHDQDRGELTVTPNRPAGPSVVMTETGVAMWRIASVNDERSIGFIFLAYGALPATASLRALDQVCPWRSCQGAHGVDHDRREVGCRIADPQGR